MMQNRRQNRLPVWPIILDIFGTLLLALGIYLQFGGEALLFAEFLDIRQLAIPIILAGLLLMLPLIFILVRRSTTLQ